MDPKKRRKRIDWSKAPIVFVEAATCRNCGSPRYDLSRSLGNGDSSRTKFVVCRVCGEPFKIVIELPESGKV